MILNRTKQKLAGWKCYRSGHQYSYEQLRRASMKLWHDEVSDGTIKCQRCGKETEIEESENDVLQATRINRSVANMFKP